jgi:hypothetical protein
LAAPSHARFLFRYDGSRMNFSHLNLVNTTA